MEKNGEYNQKKSSRIVKNKIKWYEVESNKVAWNRI